MSRRGSVMALSFACRNHKNSKAATLAGSLGGFSEMPLVGSGPAALGVVYELVLSLDA